MRTAIGFIGQGWIGKHYADDFEARGYNVVRYALEEEYVGNKNRIQECGVVFVAVPTPTTSTGFDRSSVEDALSNVKAGSTAIIKSTIVPGTTEELQAMYPEIVLLHSPEFLVEKTAAYDAAHPRRNIVGIPIDNDEYRRRAEAVLDVLPDAPYERIMSSRDAEFIKYAGNCFLFTKVIYINLLYDLVQKTDGNWQDIREALVQDPRIGISHTEPLHDGGRGAGGHCFIKDFEMFRKTYDTYVGDAEGSRVLTSLAEKNIELLRYSGKNEDLLDGVYG